ncbi:hypothetical protein [Commensalibacter papalotli (ex Botero et al. 2024)]|uniref:hypothetical protein n=1 Tax=Commensalibacter papalotli (ex Botero et al. 2024) TaxID=2972766 RepID=UPI0022FF6AEB|nr:hypothetical protein [Commensalibacter papalotli (ex Botero et al. 2024)]CAI3936810.1 Ubiquinone/menaquinone biosynthesis C-methylase UbiE/MenG (UbiE) (PDB:4OBW) [Commensalibacter papalotli (ex Botero et al. 2024)]
MAYDFNSILVNQCQKKQGITTYLQYKLTQLWPNLCGLSLFTLGQTFSLFPQKTWYPHYHLHGVLDSIPNCNLKHLYHYNQKTCCFSTDSFPLQDCSIDRILYVHDAKVTQQQFYSLLRSCWNTLNDDGKIILLLPNKLGWWSIIDNLSLRYRNSFFIQKLNIILKQHMFHISHYERVIYFPPKVMNSLSLRNNKILEFIGVFFVPFLGGYHLIEIEKNLYAPITVTPLRKNYILQEKLSKTSLNLTNSDQ